MSKTISQTLKILIIVLVPLIIVPGVVRLLTTDHYLAFEYGKSDFPKDIFGFDQSQRLNHASDNLRYLVENKPSDFLASQKHNNTALYDQREVSHMQDVQYVFQGVWRVWEISLILFFICALALLVSEGGSKQVAAGLKIGGLVTVGLFTLLGISAAVAWDGWFTLFHRFFFVDGSWLFNYTDTLIRLFPQKFWFDSAITLVILSSVGGLLLALAGQFWVKKSALVVNA
jgi:integral membrane protein (TIGR01906 family)